LGENSQQSPKSAKYAGGARIRHSECRILFSADEYRWVSQSIQHVLAADLSHGSQLKVIAPANADPAADSDAALKSAADAGATLARLKSSIDRFASPAKCWTSPQADR
jgi:hypothetical protein